MQLVMVHGSGSGRETWHYQLAAFPGAHAVDLPGHPDGELCGSVPDYTEWLAGDVAAAGLRDLVVVGHSLGGAIALQYALDYPAQVRALVVIGSGARLRVHPATLAELESMAANPDQGSFDPRSGYEKVDEEVAGILARRRLENGVEARLADLRACDKFDVMDRLGGITVPALVICGAQDVMTPPKYSRFLADRLPDARAVIIPDCTHLVHLEAPEAVNGEINTFISTLS